MIKSIITYLSHWGRINFELLFWVCALLVLAISVPGSNHYSLCPLSNLGFEWCTGCGLGHSISYLFRMDITASFQSHPFGLFALVVIVSRIIALFKTMLLPKHQKILP